MSTALLDRRAASARSFVVLLVTTLLLGLAASAASAHVSLTRTKINAGEAKTLAFRAPIEREGRTNAKLESLVPDGFIVEDCLTPDGWTCSTEDRNDGTVIVWDALTVGTPNDIRFEFDVVAPDQLGEYLFPSIQTYSDGEEVAWINPEADSANPSPRIEVVAPDAEVAETEAPPPAHGGDDPAPSEEPSAEPTPTQDDEPATDEPTTTDEPTEDVTTQPDDSVTEPDTTESTTVDVTDAPEVDDDAPADNEADVALDQLAEDDGGAPTGIIIAVIALAAIGGGAFVFARSRG